MSRDHMTIFHECYIFVIYVHIISLATEYLVCLIKNRDFRREIKIAQRLMTCTYAMCCHLVTKIHRAVLCWIDRLPAVDYLYVKIVQLYDVIIPYIVRL